MSNETYRPKGHEAEGALVLVGTPIGNLGDVSARTKEAIEKADLVLAEDSRRARKLLSHLSISSKRVLSYHPGNFRRRTAEVLEEIRRGKKVALLTDAGMPAISDPGEELVAAAASEGLVVDCVPGPSAVLVALVLSGMPTRRFAFEGFPPRQASRRNEFFRRLVEEERTVVFFEAPHRLVRSLCDARQALGPERRAAVCRELTKMHQEVVRGTLDELVSHFQREKPRGEFVVVLGPPEKAIEKTRPEGLRGDD